MDYWEAKTNKKYVLEVSKKLHSTNFQINVKIRTSHDLQTVTLQFNPAFTNLFRHVYLYETWYHIDSKIFNNKPRYYSVQLETLLFLIFSSSSFGLV